MRSRASFFGVALGLALPASLVALAAGCGGGVEALAEGAGGGGGSGGSGGHGNTTGTGVAGSAGAPGFHAIQLAISHTFCALLDDGTVACWGFNQRGQLGIGTSDAMNHLKPERVKGLSDVIALRQGWDTTCAILGSGGVKCWGWGATGQLGNGHAADGYFSAVPVEVSGLSGALDLSIAETGEYACAVTSAGKVVCWGTNAGTLGFTSPECGPYAGTTGDGMPTETMQPCQATPAEVPGIEGVAEVALGWIYQCAWNRTTGATCWGAQTSDANPGAPYEPPSKLALPGPIETIAIGTSHACALSKSGAVSCWGDNVKGQLGVGKDPAELPSSKTPLAVPGITSATYLHVDTDETCAIHDGGAISCWGDATALLGLPGSAPAGSLYVEAPTAVPGVTNAVEIGTDYSVGCVRDPSDAVACWEANPEGKLVFTKVTW